MTQGVPVSDDLCRVIMHMSTNCGLDVKDIVYLTAVPRASVYWILNAWKQTGEECLAPHSKSGRPRALDFTDTQI